MDAGAATAAPTVSCPVCLHPASGEYACPQCGWTLTDGPWVGHVTAEHQRTFDQRLAAAQRAVDMRAALSAAGFPGDGDPALLRRLAGLVRGGAAQSPEIEVARSALVGVPATPDQTLITETVAPALARLVAEPASGSPGSTASRLTLIELTADGITTAVLATDELGTPCLVTAIRSVGWRELLPTLPIDPGEGRFVLAGGVYAARPRQPVTDGDLAALAADPRILPQPSAGPGEVVLLNRVATWPVPDRLLQKYRDLAVTVGGARLRRSEVRLSPTGSPLNDVLLAELISLAPLRFGYGLVLATVDERTRTVRPVVHSLFQPGAIARHTASATVRVFAPATEGRPLILAVVAGHPNAEPRHCRPVTIVRARLRPGREHQIEIGLAGPAQVIVRRPPDGVPENVTGASQPHWEDLLRQIPTVYHGGRMLDLDLAFAVELGGQPAAAVTRRLALVDETIRLIDNQHPEPESVRFGIIGYSDHLSNSPDRVVTVHDFGPATASLEFLSTLRPAPQVAPYAAPAEDALYAVGQLRWRRAPAARVLVIIGGRRPHPTESDSVPACPNRHDWRELLTDSAKAGVRRVAVWDQPPWCSPESRNIRDRRATQNAWAVLGGGQRPHLDQVDAQWLTIAARVLPPKEPGPTLLFPITTISQGQRPGGRRHLEEESR